MTSSMRDDAPAHILNRRARVRVPCSTSNVGGGFDCIGIALDRWLEAEAWLRPEGGRPRIARSGALAALDAASVLPEDDLMVRGVALACAAAGAEFPGGLSLSASSDIPVARGLGSSAAGLVAGALLADALLGLGLGALQVARVCASEEGHPDNAAPIVLGGAVLGVPRGDDWTFAPLEVHPGVGIVVAIPEFETSTRAMRAALPEEVPFDAAVRAAGKGAALVRGLATADAALLAWALDDVVHVPYRRALVEGYDLVERAAIAAGAFGATLSGAGSSMIALAPHERLAAVGSAMAGAWRGIGIDAQPWIARLATGAEVRPAG
jgi:homoserine kinase